MNAAKVVDQLSLRFSKFQVKTSSRRFFRAELESLTATQRVLSGASDSAANTKGSAYETTTAVAEYLNFHYGTIASPVIAGLPKDAISSLANAPQRVGRLCEKHLLDTCARKTEVHALDVGCAVGGTTFELARFADKVVGVDASESFIATAHQLKKAGSLRFSFPSEGDTISPKIATVPGDIDRGRCEFACVDVECFDPRAAVSLEGFHLVLACNVLCRLQRPRAWLESLPSLLAPGGIVVLVTPYAWLDTWTNRSEWLGGHNGEVASEIVSEIMCGLGFVENARDEVPFLLAQNDRIYELFVSELSVWRCDG